MSDPVKEQACTLQPADLITYCLVQVYYSPTNTAYALPLLLLHDGSHPPA